MTEEAKKRVETAAELLERSVNVMGDGEDMEWLVGKMANMHRTLVQSFAGKFIIPYVRKLALFYKEGYYDLRNEQVCKACFLMWEAFKKEYNWTDDDPIPHFALI